MVTVSNRIGLIFILVGVIEIVAGLLIAKGYFTWRPDWLLKFMIVGKSNLGDMQKTAGRIMVIFGIIQLLFILWFLAV